MEAVIDVKNPIAVRIAGMQALNEHLGPEATKAFVRGFRRSGDYTAEKQAQPDATQEDIETYGKELLRFQAEEDAGNKVWKC